MDKIRNKVIILVGTILLGFLIVSNISLEEGKKASKNLTALEYKEALEERSQLYKDIEGLDSINNEMKTKINEYHNSGNRSEKVVSDMKRQLLDYGMVNGNTNVTGEGVVLTISDGDINRATDNQYELWSKLFHDNDLAHLINEIRASGAETFAIDDHRVLTSTGVTCEWAFIGFDDGKTESAPFTIYIIGDSEKMYSSLVSENSYLTHLINRKLNITIEKKEKIEIPATTQSLDVHFMERKDK